MSTGIPRQQTATRNHDNQRRGFAAPAAHTILPHWRSREGGQFGRFPVFFPQSRTEGGTDAATSSDPARNTFKMMERRLMAIVVIGANSGSLVAKLQGASASGGSFTDISGAAATAVTAGSKTLTIEVRDDQVGDSQRFVRLLLTEGNTANCVCGAVVLGGEAQEKPAKANDVASIVTQRLVV